MAQKLNQIIAIEKGAKKNRVYSANTELHKNAQKSDLYFFLEKRIMGNMFPKLSLKMLLLASILLITGCLINALVGNPVNIWFLGIGLLVLIYSTAMLFFKK